MKISILLKSRDSYNYAGVVFKCIHCVLGKLDVEEVGEVEIKL